MPCNADYMTANSYEIELSRVFCFLDELAGRKWTKADYDGYHPDAYCKGVNRERADKFVAALCKALSKTDVTKYSLELQIWWRDHQAIDKAREERERIDSGEW